MSKNVKLDRIDINILSQLQQNGKLTNINLSDAVGLSASPCLQRVKRLEKAGFIESYKAQLNLKKLADHVMVFTEITLTDQRREDFIKFETQIRQFASVQECHLLSGGYDYLVKFVARSVSHYQEIMESILERNMGVEKYFSYIVIKSLINKDSVPLKAILPEDDQ